MLTAAHCVDGDTKIEEVAVGEVDTSKNCDCAGDTCAPLVQKVRPCAQVFCSTP